MPEPKVLLLGGNRGRWSAKDSLAEATTMNSGEAWIYAFGGDFIQNLAAKPADLQGYDIIIANCDSFAIKHLYELMQSRPSGGKWVSLLEGDALDYIKPRPYVRDLLDGSDLVNCINKHTLSFFRKFTSAKVEYIGFPYPAEGIRALSTPLSQRRREIFLAPMLLSRWMEYFCVKDMGVPLYGYEKRLSRRLKTIFKNLYTHGTLDPNHLRTKARSLYRDSGIEIRQETGLAEFFRHNGSALLWLNLDHRYTWGRYVLDAAALQVPIVTTRSTGHAENFFPKTMIESEFDIDEATDLVQRLLNDKDFYDEVAHVPIEKFDEFRPEVKKKQFLDALYSESIITSENVKSNSSIIV